MPHNESVYNDHNLVNYNPGNRYFKNLIKSLYNGPDKNLIKDLHDGSDKNSDTCVNLPELFKTPKDEIKADFKIVKKDEEDIKTDNIKIQDDNKTISILEHVMTTNLSNSHDIKAFVRQMENEILNIQKQEQKLSNKINLDTISINKENKDIRRVLPQLGTDNNTRLHKVELFGKISSNPGSINPVYEDQITHLSSNGGDLLTKLNH